MGNENELVWEWANAADFPNLRREMPTVSYFMAPRWIWEPQPDITTYELALCLGCFMSGIGILDLPESAQRHFKQVA
jgi:hypothetical protein